MRIFLDLDGTLIGPSGSVSEPVWRAIDDAREAGARMSVCTGRPGAGVALRVARRVDPLGPHIFENGALITPANGEPLQVAALAVADLEKLVEKSKSTPAVLELYTAHGIFVSRYNEDCRSHEEVLDIDVVERNLGEVIREFDVARAHWIMRPETLETTLDLDLAESEVGVASSPVLPTNVFASITRKGVSKGSAARWIIENFGDDPAQTAAVGDAPSDRAVLDAVARPFVMANSPPEMHGDYQVIGHVNEDGVIEAFERMRAEF